LASKANGYSSQIGTHDSPFFVSVAVPRHSLFSSNSWTTTLEGYFFKSQKVRQECTQFVDLCGVLDRCSECSMRTQLFYNETTRTWILNDAAVDSGAVDIQCIVECANSFDTIMLPTNGVLKPNETIKIDKPLTITGFHEGVRTNEGTYPAAENKTVISCPEGSSKGIFDIQCKDPFSIRLLFTLSLLYRSDGVTIANLQIRDCLLDGHDVPIVIQNCKDNEKDIRIHQVEFVNNTHKSQLVAFDVPESSSCGRLEMTNVTFKDNQATGRVSVVRLGSTTIMRNVTIDDNKQKETGIRKAFLLFTTSSMWSNILTLDGLVVRRNQMPILRSKSGIIKILNSQFRGNKLRIHDASMLQFLSTSKVEVKNRTLKKNTGSGRGMITLKSASSVEILKSDFISNSKFGSVIFSTLSQLNISNSDFIANTGASDGGVIHLENSNATLTQTVFTDNRSDGNGGSVYAATNSTLTVTNSTFMTNEASDGGCFYIEKSNASIVESTFRRNKADIDGGAIRLEDGGCTCYDSVFEDNSSLDEGGAIHIENARYVTLQTVSFTSKNDANGSVVRIEKSRTNVTLKDVHFHGGVVELTGAALYIDDSEVTIDGATFTNNAGPYGGAIYAQKFDITIKNAKFVNNSATVMGGAISGDNGNTIIENTTFEENRSYLGGALHFYNTTFNGSEIVFVNNHASEGGALLCKDSNVTIGPRPIATEESSKSAEAYRNLSFGIRARNNSGIDGGGAIDAIDSNIHITYGTFSNNTASEGGAIQVTSSKLTSISISHSWFGENIADVRGGGLAVRSANEGHVSLEMSFANFSRCTADQGGAVFLTSVNAVIEDSNFVKNIAIEGGAAFFRKNVRLIENNGSKTDSVDISIGIKNCRFKGNTAGEYGGALVLRGEAIVNRSSMTSEECLQPSNMQKKDSGYP